MVIETEHKLRAAEYLGQIRRINARINSMLREKQQIMDLATKVTPTLSDMPRGTGTTDKVAAYVVKLNSIEAEINRTIDHYVDTRDEILKLLETLPVDEYTVLHNYFVIGMTFAEIGEHMQPRPKSERQVYRIKKKGMKRVQGILDARGQSRE